MNQQLINAILTALIPILGTMLPGVLKRDGFSPAVNGIIAGVIVLLASAGTAYTRDQLGPDFFRDAFIIGAALSAMLGGPLKPLDAFLQSNIFASKVVPTAVVPTIRRSSIVTKATDGSMKPGSWAKKTDDSQSG